MVQADRFLEAVEEKRKKEHLKTEQENDASEINIHRQPISFTQAINHVPIKGSSFMIADSKYSSYVAMVLVAEKELTINVYDKNNNFVKKYYIPVVKEKNIDGYRTIVNIQKEYGFSDRVITFDRVSDYKSYINNEQSNRETKKKTLK